MDDPVTSHTDTAAHPLGSALTDAIAGLTAGFGWLMCTLATGAIAAFVAMLLRVRPYWLILLFALPLTWVLKMCGGLYARWASVVAVLAILLAGFYAACLAAIARIAAATGFPYGLAFQTGGIGLTLQVAELGLDAKAILAYAAAAILAALLAAKLARKRER